MRPALLAGVGAAVALLVARRLVPAAAPSDQAEEPGALETFGADAMGAINTARGTDAASLQVSDRGRQAIRAHEALRLTRYRLGDGGWTIGWGRYFPDSGPPPPEVIDRATADAWFDEDLEARGAKWVRAYVTAPLTQSQFDALVSMAYNLRPSSFRTIAAAVNAGDDPEAAAMVYTRPGSNLERGLRNRRVAELTLYRSEGVA